MIVADHSLRQRVGESALNAHKSRARTQWAGAYDLRHEPRSQGPGDDRGAHPDSAWAKGPAKSGLGWSVPRDAERSASSCTPQPLAVPTRLRVSIVQSRAWQLEITICDFKFDPDQATWRPKAPAVCLHRTGRRDAFQCVAKSCCNRSQHRDHARLRASAASECREREALERRGGARSARRRS